MSARRRRAPLSETAAVEAPAVTYPDLRALVGKQSKSILELLQRSRDRNRAGPARQAAAAADLNDPTSARR